MTSMPEQLTARASLTLEQYAGPYLAHPDFTTERRANATHMIECVNAVIGMAEADGIVFETNPHTGCLISGDGNGGFRPQSCRIGAPDSAHKQGQGIDIRDTAGRHFARWCLQNVARLKAAGICAIENPRWTPTWVHLQTRPVPSGHFAFIPSASPPLAPPLPEQA
jgi:hypothetical protein